MDEWTCGFQRSPRSLGVRLRRRLGLGNHSNKKASHSETATCNRVQVFYEVPDYDSDDSEEEWVEDLEPLSLLSRAFKAMKRKSKQNAAIEVYKRRSDDDYEKFYIAKVHFDIRSLRDAINGVLKPDGFTLRYFDDDTFESTAPHSALYFARHQISELAKMSDDDEVRSRCALLRDVIQEIFLDTFKEIAELNKEGAITFDLLWTLFPPGEVYAIRPLTSGHPIKTMRVTSFRQDSLRATLHNETVGFNGFCFTNRDFRYTMPSFHGKIELSRMHFQGGTYLNLDEDNGKLREELIARGRKILDFQRARYMMYMPEPAGDQEATNPWVAEKTQQRVVCDYYMKAKLPPEPPSPPGMNPKGGNPVRPAIPPLPTYFESQLPGYKGTTMIPMRSCRPTQAEMKINCRVLTESEDNLLLMHPYVPSYNLDTNTWFDANIDRLEPIVETDETVFDRVTYDEEKKEVLKTLVENHRQCGGDQDDLISRKGQALVVLLEGWHGTGKKHIVKALAEQLGCPLIRGFEQNLATYPNIKLPILLEQATEWGALLLFDDPDFLSLYSSRPMGVPGPGFWKVQDFLRHVEAFKGIIFLATTRQTRDINTTILSRADAHLSFPVFDEELRKQVWEKFLNRLPEDTGLCDSLLSPGELSATLAKWVMNGRQIKNIVNLSTSWCRQMKCPLDLDVIKKMISTTCPSAFEATDDSGTDDETVQNELAVRPPSVPRWGPPPPPGIAWHASSPSSKKKKNKKNNEEQQT